MTAPCFLLDTHALVWWMADESDLSARVRLIIANPDNAVLVSAASLWEIAIRQRKGFLKGCEEYLARFESWHERWGFGTLHIRPAHAVLAGSLEWIHKDPFDRMLVAQSNLTGATLVTCDETVATHHPNCVWN